MASRQPAASFGRRLEALGLTLVLLIVTLGIGWLVWTVLEWRNGLTPSYRLLGLRVVRRDDGRPIGLARSLVRSGICCTVLIVPTVVIGAVVAISFAIGASPPDGLLRQPRAAPWDRLTATTVIDERAAAALDPASEREIIGPVGLTDAATPQRQNGHVPHTPRG
jgi:RDD family